MPGYKRKRIGYTGASRTKRARKASNGVMSTSKLSGDHRILSTSKVVTMRYAEQFSIDPTASVPGTYIFNANGLFDPNFTGTGHQPRGYDELMSMYRRYEVQEALLEIWADTNDLTSGVVLGLSVRSSSAAVLDRNDMIEHRTAQLKAVAGSDGGPSVVYHKIAVKPADFLGLKAGADDTLRGVQGSNPTSGVYFHVQGIPMRATDTGSIHIQSRLTFKVKLSEPKEPASS